MMRSIHYFILLDDSSILSFKDEVKIFMLHINFATALAIIAAPLWPLSNKI